MRSPWIFALLALAALVTPLLAQADYGSPIACNGSGLLCLSRDDKSFITAESEQEDGRIQRLVEWDVAAGRPKRLLPVTGLSQIRFSENRDRFLAYDDKRHVELHAFPSGRLLWEAVAGNVFAISADNRYVATGDEHGVEVRDGATGQVLFGLDADAVNEMDFSPDSRCLALIDGTDTVEVWDLATSSQLWREKTRPVISGLCFSPDGQRVAVSNYDPGITEYAARTGTRLFSAAIAGAPKYLANGRLCTFESDRCEIGVMDARKRHFVGPILSHSTHALNCQITPDGKTLFTEANGINRWDIASGRLLDKYGNPASESMLWQTSGRIVLVGRQFLVVNKGAAEVTTVPERLIERTEGNRLAFSADLSRFGQFQGLSVTNQAESGMPFAAESGGLALTNVSRQTQRRIPVKGINNEFLGLSKDGSWFLVSRSKFLPAWRLAKQTFERRDARTGKLLNSFSRFKWQSYDFATLSRDCRLLVHTEPDMSAFDSKGHQLHPMDIVTVVLDTQTGRVISKFPGEFLDSALSEDASIACEGASGDTIKVRNLRTGAYAWPTTILLPRDGPKDFHFSYDNRYLLVFDHHHHFQSWSAEAGRVPPLIEATPANLAPFLARRGVVAIEESQGVTLFDCSHDRAVGTLLPLAAGYLLVTPDGRYDCSSLADVRAVCFLVRGRLALLDPRQRTRGLLAKLWR